MQGASQQFPRIPYEARFNSPDEEKTEKKGIKQGPGAVREGGNRYLSTQKEREKS